MRAAIGALAVGAVAAAGWLALAASGSAVMPSYLAAWLLVFGIPAGALLLVMGQEALGSIGWAALPVLRRAALLLPVVSLFAIPVLTHSDALYRRPGGGASFPAAWMVDWRFDARAAVILVLLSVLAVVFSRTPVRARRRLAVLGCVLQVCLVSVAAVDWVMALQPGLNSSSIGLLLIASQLGTACCLLAFVLAVRSRDPLRDRGLGLLLAVGLTVSLFLHFEQFLVIWSADLPNEIVWYQARTGGLGTAALAFGATATALGVVLLPSGLARAPAALASLSAMLLLMRAVETLWLVTPAFRGRFLITLPDALATIGFAGIVTGLLLMLLPQQEAAHA